MSKKYLISRDEVQQSWEAVVRAAGGPGLDGKTIQEIASKLEGELYTRHFALLVKNTVYRIIYKI